MELRVLSSFPLAILAAYRHSDRHMRTARIAVMMPRFSRYGGAEGFGYRLAEVLAKAGHEVDFICARSDAEPPQGVTPVIVGRFGPLKWLKVLWFAVAAERARKRGRYDLSIGLGKCLRQDVFRQGGGPLPVFWRLSKRAWKPGPERCWKMLRRRLSLSNWVGWWIEKQQAQTTPLIVANSQRTKEWMVEAHPHLDPDEIPVIFNRPDLSRFAPASAKKRADLRKAAGIRDDQVLILTAGTNFALKGIRPMLEALSLLPHHYILHVAGGRGPEKYLKLAKTLAVADRVRFCGKIDDMAAFYATGDVFCLATFYDASSNAVMEALASGLQVVSSASNGSCAFLDDKRIVPDPSDVETLAHVIARAANAPKSGPFVWPEHAQSGMDAWVALIEKVVADKRSGKWPSID